MEAERGKISNHDIHEVVSLVSLISLLSLVSLVSLVFLVFLFSLVSLSPSSPSYPSGVPVPHTEEEEAGQSDHDAELGSGNQHPLQPASRNPCPVGMGV
jgi:hypothetical protein